MHCNYKLLVISVGWGIGRSWFILLEKKMLKTEGLSNGLGANRSTNASKLLLASYLTVPSGAQYALLVGPHCTAVLSMTGAFFFSFLFWNISPSGVGAGSRKYDNTFALSKWSHQENWFIHSHLVDNWASLTKPALLLSAFEVFPSCFLYELRITELQAYLLL